MSVSVRTTETFHLNRVREYYAEGRLTAKRLERAVEHVLRGGYLDHNLAFRSPLLDRVRARRKCATEGHLLIDLSGFGDSLGQHRCSRCDYEEKT